MPPVNDIIHHIDWLFAARHGDFTDGESANLLKGDLDGRCRIYSCAGKLVDSSFATVSNGGAAEGCKLCTA